MYDASLSATPFTPDIPESRNIQRKFSSCWSFFLYATMSSTGLFSPKSLLRLRILSRIYMLTIYSTPTHRYIFMNTYTFTQCKTLQDTDLHTRFLPGLPAEVWCEQLGQVLVESVVLLPVSVHQTMTGHVWVLNVFSWQQHLHRKYTDI